MNAIWIAVAAVSLLGLAFGAILGYASRRFAVEDDPVVEKIDEILPQSQCGQCGYPGCRPYAEAISCNGEKINRCAPGGEAVMLKIAELLNVEPQPLDGEAQELTPARLRAGAESYDRSYHPDYFRLQSSVNHAPTPTAPVPPACGQATGG